MELKTLDTLIAVVVVILLLSLIVQAIQGAIKKVLALKAIQIEDSLVDLFENVFGKQADGQPIWLRRVLANTFGRPLRLPDTDPVGRLFNTVCAEFARIGRVSANGKRMLDSVSKEDLLKVVAKVLPDQLDPTFSQRMLAAVSKADGLAAKIDAVVAVSLPGEANAKFAALRDAVSPLVKDLKAFLAPPPPPAPALRAGLIVRDVLALRHAKFDEALGLLGDIQAKVEAELPGATDGSRAALEAADAGLKGVADAVSALRTDLDAALAPLRAQLTAVETWFDTVMQSFEERYNRGMRTWAFAISLAVVGLMNANIFSIYRNIATNDVTRARAVSAAPAVQQMYHSSQPAVAPTSQPAAGGAGAAAIRTPAPTTETAGPPAAGQASTPATLRQVVNDTHDTVKAYVSEYGAFGFEPHSREQWASPGSALSTLVGWVVMALLLSLGAPFWHDALESLFGVKNLLRKKADIQLTEQQSGAGYPRT